MFNGVLASGGTSAAGAVWPRARSSKVTVIVEATVVVRKFRRLQPAALFFENVMSVPTLARFECIQVSMSRNGAGSAVAQGRNVRMLREFLWRHEFAFAAELCRGFRRIKNDRFQAPAYRHSRKAGARNYRS